MREIMNVTSEYEEDANIITVKIEVGKRDNEGNLRYDCTFAAKAEWNRKPDPHSFSECFKIAYERALAKIPDENIIEKCGGLKDGDWVCVSPDNKWGIVFNDNILYIAGSGGFDKVGTFSNGESIFDRITTIVRPIDSCYPVTYHIVRDGNYKNTYRDYCEVYTAD